LRPSSTPSAKETEGRNLNPSYGINGHNPELHEKVLLPS
jgi:hypothetical protein